MKWQILGLLGAVLMLPCVDEKPPAESADLQLILKRLDTLEDRVTALEARNAVEQKIEQPQPAKTKPVLLVHSETWCGPCQTFKADVAAYGELPVEIRYERFSRSVPAFRWTNSSGQTITRTGYARGTLGSLLREITGE